MARNEFEREVGRFLEEYMLVAERIDDAAFNRYGGRQVKKKPYDFYGASRAGLLFGAEVKRVKTRRFPFREIKEHQRRALAELAKKGCLAWLFINWRLGGPRGTGQAIWVSWARYKLLEEVAKAEGRKHLKADDFGGEDFLERITGGWQVDQAHPLFLHIVAAKRGAS